MASRGLSAVVQTAHCTRRHCQNKGYTFHGHIHPAAYLYHSLYIICTVLRLCMSFIQISRGGSQLFQQNQYLSQSSSSWKSRSPGNRAVFSIHKAIYGLVLALTMAGKRQVGSEKKLGGQHPGTDRQCLASGVTLGSSTPQSSCIPGSGWDEAYR